MKFYSHFASITPEYFNKIYSVSISELGYHFTDSIDYPVIFVTPINEKDKRCKIDRIVTGFNSEVAITVQRQYLFLYDKIDYDYYWFIQLLKQFEEPFREVITFNYKRGVIILDDYINCKDEFMMAAVRVFSHIVAESKRTRKPFDLEAIYFVQICNILE